MAAPLLSLHPVQSQSAALLPAVLRWKPLAHVGVDQPAMGADDRIKEVAQKYQLAVSVY